MTTYTKTEKNQPFKKITILRGEEIEPSAEE